MFGVQVGKLGKTKGISWSERALWPNGASSPGMWIDPSLLTASFNDYAGTTPVATPGSVADSANPVGLALDIRAGAPDTLGPELVTNGDFSAGASGWAIDGDDWVITTGSAAKKTTGYANGSFYRAVNASAATVRIDITVTVNTTGYGPEINCAGASYTDWTAKTGVYTFIVPGFNGNLKARNSTASAGDLVITSISVREIPGNHNMLQSTSAARPLESARVNLLTKTEELNNAIWISTAAGSTITSGVSDPLGGTTAFTITATSPNGQAYQNLNTVTLPRIASGYIRRRSGSGNVIFYADGGAGGTNITAQVTPSWMPFSVASSTSFGSWYVLLQNSGDAIDVWHPQVETGSVATTYQRVGAASDYTATGFPQYLKFDGVDDALSSATFAAGTLTSSMDCLIAVRRDSAARMIVGLYNTAGDGTRYFGEATNDPGAFVCFSGVGTPTVWVDGVQLPGGTAVTIGTLYNALTVGSWNILEFRGLNLSTWTQLSYGGYPTWYVNGGLGGIQLFASGQDANRTKARARMAAYFGVTLP